MKKCERRYLFKSWLESSVTVSSDALCCHSCTLAQQLLCFFVEQKANPDIYSSYVESVRRNINLDAGVMRYYSLHFFCSFYKFEAAPLHFFGVQDENLFVSKRDCRRMDAQGGDHCTCVPSTAAPSSC